jgi:hypothetical protein
VGGGAIPVMQYEAMPAPAPQPQVSPENAGSGA